MWRTRRAPTPPGRCPERGGPEGFCVVSLTPPRAFLAELLVPAGDRAGARVLVARAAAAARAAGCERLEFFAPPGAPALSLLRRCGLVPLRSHVFVYLRAPGPADDFADPARWRLTPGDSEVV